MSMIAHTSQSQRQRAQQTDFMEEQNDQDRRTNLGLFQLLHDGTRALEHVDPSPLPFAEDEALARPLLGNLRQTQLDLELLVRALRDLLDVLCKGRINGGSVIRKTFRAVGENTWLIAEKNPP